MENLILITIDCLRQDFLHLNLNLTFETSRRLFDKGLSFVNMISAGANTPLAFPSLFSSSYPSMHSGYGGLDENILTLAEVLKDHGYATAGIHSNPHLISQYNYNKGFAHFSDYSSSKKSMTSRFVGGFRRRFKERFKHNQRIKAIIDWLSDNKILAVLAHRYISDKKPYDDAKTINARAIQWLIDGRNRRDPFFLWLHYMEPHTPYEIYDCTKEICKQRNIDQSKASNLFLKGKQEPENITDIESEALRFLYLTQIKYLDFQLRELFESLSKKGFLDKTMIVITADHGEEFFEHGLFQHAPGFHQKSRDIYLFNTVLRIPFIIYGDDIKAGRNDSLASSIDIAPTICGLMGVESPRQWLGNNMLLRDFNRKMAVSEQVYWEEGKISGAYAFQTRHEKYIYNHYDRSYQYYQLDNDPGEMLNQIDAHPEKKAEIDRLYTAHREMILKSGTCDSGPVDTDDETERRLKALGYL